METKVIHIIAETLKISPDSIRPEHKLIELVHDSIQLFELLIRFESELGRSVSYEDVAAIETVQDIISYAKALDPIPA